MKDGDINISVASIAISCSGRCRGRGLLVKRRKCACGAHGGDDCHAANRLFGFEPEDVFHSERDVTDGGFRRRARLESGVNEMQSVSNAIGSCGVQTNNRAGSAALRAYFESYVEYGRTFSDKRKCARVITQVQPMLMDLESLIEAEAHDGGKHVSLLLVSCFCARLLNGARTTSCKSAKDRTSMFQTLEVCQHALRCGLIQSADDLQTIVDELRGDNGVRLCNAEEYWFMQFAFNSVQVGAPEELRPPASAASGGVVT